ncbi:hypothetical protein PC112_g18125 [Phytophthora cactorum]|nr:hypothetical protein PC112_g23128 [Phytophthora cactorum]KAG2805781.1 hypothetical protein PC112_g18125 [Phytophthora cactorum]KAG3001417.1 hypothetical protein PC121_g25627 [Phytophthora cactorum]KAG3050482.1 hypothetical protein PC122_g23238 [Phytophthora cactorum]KAG3066226.1 hypothetical protein PC122_g17884 [Phytophthora cactorum]
MYATSGRVQVVIYNKHPINDLYGLDRMSSRSAFVAGDCNFDNFIPVSHGFTTVFECSWLNLLTTSST